MDIWEHKRQTDEAEAQVELSKINAMKILLSNNLLACEVEICGVKLGVCENEWLLPVIQKQKEEIDKFLRREENKWE